MTRRRKRARERDRKGAMDANESVSQVVLMVWWWVVVVCAGC
jgi:hypothetical protein